MPLRIKLQNRATPLFYRLILINSWTRLQQTNCFPAAPIVMPIVAAPALLDRPAAPPPPIREARPNAAVAARVAITQLAQLDYPATHDAVAASVQPADPLKQPVVAAPAAHRPIPTKDSWFPIALNDCGGITIDRSKQKKASDTTTEPKTTRTTRGVYNASAVAAFFTVTRTLGSTNIDLMKQRCIIDQDQHTCRSTKETTTNKNCNFTIVEIHQNISFGQKRAIFFEAFGFL